MPDDSPLSYCADEVRRHDPDRFTTVIFAPAFRRDALFALYAFNLEIAKVREVVSEPMLGEIRLQWWRDAVEGAYEGHPRRHAVVGPLSRVISDRGLTRDYFDGMIDARAFDLGETAPETMAALVEYAVGTSSNLVWLALEALDAKTAMSAEIGRNVGIAWALTGLLRALPFHLRARRVYLPRELTERHGVRSRDLSELRSSDAVCAAVHDVADHASEALRHARATAAEVPRNAVPALLPACLADIYLRRLRRAGFDPFDDSLARPLPFKGVRVAAKALFGRY